MKILHGMMLAAAALGTVATTAAPADAQRVVIGVGGWYPHAHIAYRYGPVWYGRPGPHYGWYGWRGGYYRNCGWRWTRWHGREWRCW